ncbi:MAG: DUF1015 family protein [Coriobacteriia bacterium]|nr:DUF1015 family protein [Coriobacteriia bacterium]
MATVLPFKALRPAAGLESKIAALPYDVYNREEAKAAVKPDSFLNIDRPETAFSLGVDMYSEEVYNSGASAFRQMIKDGKLVQDDCDCFYIYRLIMDGRCQTGIVGLSSIDEYNNGIVKKHENTRAEKEKDRIEHIKHLGAQTGPIFLTYKGDIDLTRWTEDEPEYSFTSDDGITHTVWVVRDTEYIKSAFDKIPYTYIADGHHRCASACKVGGTDYFLSVLFNKDELKIFDYNRVILDPKDFTLDDFEVYDFHKPKEKGEVAVWFKDKWQLIKLKADTNDPVKSLDVSLLQDQILEPMLGISDPKIDKNIDFVGGIRGYKELEKYPLAFGMYPTSMDELLAVADAGLLMPPKSTWFEPKLRSGLFINLLYN